MLTRSKFILISIFYLLLLLSVVMSYDSIIPYFIVIIIYFINIGFMAYKRIKYDKKKNYVENKEIEEKYKKYKSEKNN